VTRLPYTLRPEAEADLVNILSLTADRFGWDQRRRYAELIEAAIGRIAEDPERPSSTPRSDILPGLRTFPIHLAGRRRGGGAHILFYLHGPAGIRILRILHESMDPARHLLPDRDG
jgi:toxin ParE1/3/4